MPPSVQSCMTWQGPFIGFPHMVTRSLNVMTASGAWKGNTVLVLKFNHLGSLTDPWLPT